MYLIAMDMDVVDKDYSNGLEVTSNVEKMERVPFSETEINELWDIHNFDKLVSKALNFVTDNITMFYEYDQEEVVEEFLKLP